MRARVAHGAGDLFVDDEQRAMGGVGGGDGDPCARSLAGILATRPRTSVSSRQWSDASRDSRTNNVFLRASEFVLAT